MKRGLRIAYHNHVAQTRGKKVINISGAGYYIEVYLGNPRKKNDWHALLDLRFARLKDAQMAMASLTNAGLDSYYKLNKTDPLVVLQVALQNLQW